MMEGLAEGRSLDTRALYMLLAALWLCGQRRALPLYFCLEPWRKKQHRTRLEKDNPRGRETSRRHAEGRRRKETRARAAVVIMART